jgi:glycerol-3-phosphate dehydrogenase
MVESDAELGKRLIEDLPYLRAEVIYACRHEMAMTPDDVLARRTSIVLEDRDRGAGVVDEVAALMAQELGWSPEQQKSMSDAYRSALQQQMPV